MDVAGIIWITVFGVIISGAVIAAGIFVCRLIYNLIKSESTDD